MPKIPPLLFVTALALELVFCGTFVRDAAAQVAKWGVNDGLQQSATTYNDFGTWLGKPQQWNLTWADKQSTWQKQIGMFSSWMMPRLVLWHSAGRGITISMPMVIPGETLATSASGADDANWTAIGQALVADGVGDTIIRLGWEFNGSWYPWRASADPVSWVASFRRIVGLLRAVPGANFKFDWCPSMTGSVIAPATVYPGDDVVDYIGMDVYNQVKWMPTKLNTPQQHWQYNLSGNNGINLNWFATFAAAHHKPMSVPEWGQALEEPYFITQMANWIATHFVFYQVYFDSPGIYSLDNYPLSKAAFYEAFHPTLPKVEMTLAGVTIYRGP